MARRARCTIQRDDERFIPILSTMRLSADRCPVSSPRPSNDSARPSERDIEEAGMRTAASRRDGYQLLSPDGVRQHFDLRMLPTHLPASPQWLTNLTSTLVLTAPYSRSSS